MAEELKIVIGADVDDLKKGVKEAEKSLSAIRKPAEQTGKAFAEIGKQAKTTASDIAKLQPAASGAGNVLSNLSRVASDAPFGFIAIQNNLDPLLQSFGSLQKQSGSVGGAIKALASSLAGPAGLAVGFSVVSSLVTSAIQKYGSLGNALSELGAASDIASVNQRKLGAAINESIAGTAGEVGKLQDYITILSNTNNSLQQRTNAYNELKRVYPGVIQDLTTENALTKEGAQEIRNRSVALIDYIRLKGQESALVKLVEEETKKSLQTAQSQVELLKNQNSFTNKLINSFLSAGVAGTGFTKRLNEGNKELEKGAESINFFEQSLLKVREELTKQNGAIVDPSAAEKAKKALEDTAKAQEDALKKARQAQLESLNAVLTRYKREQEAIKTTAGVYGQSYLDATKKVLNAQANLDIFKVSKDSEAVKAIRTNLEAQIKQLEDDFKQRRIDAGKIEFTPLFELNKDEARARLKVIANSIAEEGRKTLRLPADIYGDALALVPKKLELKPNITLSQEAIDAINEQYKKAFNLELLQDRIKKAQELISSVVGPIVDNLFTSLEKGENIFKSLGESVKQFVIGAIKQFVKLAAISGIISLVTGVPFSAAFKSVAGGGGSGFFGGGFGGTAPIGGVSSGGFAVNVGGQFNLRGTDLVASIAQANQRIGRVG